ncbi:hypothetical protein DES53_104416 [Roseimicrobium gellanilyticum]|uniref:Uncharacterized protein n=1 Tax=Roseimicrobium gellanilyticum TaxID=748857 RepID=A0A366HQW6_9BACT|nr:DUF5682 family protein [Roseimicrobium gellanilyticum]RBP44594.1 hypothetical protein DES53_104416 [Roseimicrobium gellanilyticum]
MSSSTSSRATLQEVQRAMITPEVLYFPVRHHSPACAWQLRRWIREHRPRAVLVEGPDDFTPLITHLVDARCKPPVAIYTHYRMGGKAAKAADERCASYFPMAAYSPEWVALREGHAVGAELRFIDLDYASQRGVEREAAEHPGALHIESLQAEHHFQRSEALRYLASRCGCRDHDELWDHLIEVRGWQLSVERLVQEVAAYCWLSRKDTPQEVLEADGTAAREAVMAAAIRETLARNEEAGDPRPVLVVTGGFHSVVLPALVAASPREAKRHVPAQSHSCLTRYTFPQLDSLSGYSAGMPQPGYYQVMWEALERAEGEPLHHTTLQLLVQLGQAARSRDMSASISVADEIAAMEQASRLAQLRGHPGPSREDLWDAIRGCLVKGELGADGAAIMALASKLLTGDATGSVPPDAGVPPLVEDFRRVATAAKLPVAFGSTQNLALEIYSRENHRGVSRFLHCVEFLSVPYGLRRAGPDFLRGVEVRRVIEHWDCQWTPQTESKLIECSAYGSSVEEAASARLRAEMMKLDDEAAESAAAGVSLIIRACQMGLKAAAEECAQHLSDWVAQDASFVSVSSALSQLMLLWQSREPLEAQRLTMLPELMSTAYARACQLLEHAAQVPEDGAPPVVDACLLLNSRLAAQTRELLLDADLFWQAAARVLAQVSTPPLLRGAIAGLLHATGRMDTEALITLTQGALSPAVDDGARQVNFLAGLLKTERELAWREPRLAEAVEALFQTWTEEEFLHRLPHLRLAWSDLTPRETDRVAALVATRHGVESLQLARVHQFTEADMMQALHTTAAVEQSLRDDGLEAWLTPQSQPIPA